MGYFGNKMYHEIAIRCNTSLHLKFDDITLPRALNTPDALIVFLVWIGLVSGIIFVKHFHHISTRGCIRKKSIKMIITTPVVAQSAWNFSCDILVLYLVYLQILDRMWQQLGIYPGGLIHFSCQTDTIPKLPLKGNRTHAIITAHWEEVNRSLDSYDVIRSPWQ